MKPIDAIERDYITSNVSLELTRSIRKHCWDGYILEEMVQKVKDELEELEAAIAMGDYYGEHGILAEAAQVSATAQKLMLMVIRREGTKGALQ